MIAETFTAVLSVSGKHQVLVSVSPKSKGLSLSSPFCADIKQSFRKKSIVEEAEVPICLPRAAAVDQDVLQP